MRNFILSALTVIGVSFCCGLVGALLTQKVRSGVEIFTVNVIVVSVVVSIQNLFARFRARKLIKSEK